jgi:16S rRNA (cytosine1402-N4)-methyltransferase
VSHEAAVEHVPVFPAEIVELLRPRPGGRFLDATLGGGGHARLLLERILPGGILVGLDRDPEVVERLRTEMSAYADSFRLRCSDFAELGAALDEAGIDRVDGILLDLGLSSLQLADPQRGFSFTAAGPLDMRFDRRSGPTAAELLAALSERELAELIYRYGEERASRRLARRIAERRRQAPLRTTTELAELAAGAVPRRRPGRRAIHPATRLFQALRIAVNDEMGSLERALAAGPPRLAPGGRMAVIAFHSLEDRAVKLRFRELARAGRYRLVTRRPLRPGEAEVVRNPRSRSARLRVLERTA